MKTFERVYKVVSRIPEGKVLTYKKVSELAGIRNPKIVGFALHVNKNIELIPCHRVIRSDGTLAEGYALGGKDTQRKKLEEEGVKFIENKVNLNLYLFEA